ncbi:MAG: hypothetical protein JJE25_06995 [Bacteroidia bacterium]|nr:hypothetical protein [Bacteroidia bacterium]
MKHYRIIREKISHDIFTRLSLSYLRERFRHSGILVIPVDDNFYSNK